MSIANIPEAIVRYICESYLRNRESCAVGTTSTLQLNAVRGFRINLRESVPLRTAIRLFREETLGAKISADIASGAMKALTLTRSQRNRHRCIMARLHNRCGRRPQRVMLRHRECTNDLTYLRDHMSPVQSVEFDLSHYGNNLRHRQRSGRFILPPQLTELISPKMSIDLSAYLKVMPPTLRRIEFAGLCSEVSFTGIQVNDWPHDLTELSGVRTFDEDASQLCYPTTLRKLILGQTMRTPYSKGWHTSLPSSLTELVLPPYINLLIDEETQFPPLLERLTFCNLSLKDVKLPKGLKYLNFGGWYNHPFQDVVLPPTLTTLMLSHNFNHSLALPFRLPDSITEMNLPRDFTHPIDSATVFPSELRKLNIEMRDVRSLCDTMHLPSSLRELSLVVRTGTSVIMNLRRVPIPDTVETLTLDYGSVESGASSQAQPHLSRLNIPLRLRNLKFQGTFHGQLEQIQWLNEFRERNSTEAEEGKQQEDADQQQDQRGGVHVDLGCFFDQPIKVGDLPSSCTSLSLSAIHSRICLGDYSALPPRMRTLHLKGWTNEHDGRLPPPITLVFSEK